MLYPQRPAAFARQLLLDLLVVALVLGALWSGRALHDLVDQLAGPGQQLEQAGGDFAGSTDRFAERVRRLPLVGDDVQDPLHAVAGAGRTLRAAGQRQQDVVHRVALALGLLTAGLPVLFLLGLYVPGRVRRARQAGAARDLRRAPSGNDHLFALRALVNRDLTQLRDAVGDPDAAYARGDYAALARVELRALGLRDR